MKLKGAAMYYALTISLVVSVMLSMLLLLAFYFRTNTVNLAIQNGLIHNSLSGLEYLKSSSISNGVYQIDLFNENKDSVLLVKRQWGLFENLASKAFHQDKSFTKAAFFGGNSSVHNKTSLYFSDNSKSISICGNTKIIGNAYLPKGGVKRANIEGKNYVGSKLIYGNSLSSKTSLPDLSITYKNQNLNSFKEYSIDINYQDLEFYSNKYRSFTDSTWIISENGSFSLNGVNLSGNIILKSEGIIKLNRSSLLEDVLIIADAVIIGNGFEGSIHIIAVDSVIIEEKVQLNYPSSIFVNSENASKVQLKKESRLEGAIVVNGENRDNKKSFVLIEKEVEIIGDVYCNGIVVQQGSILGSLFCEGFYLKTPSAIYENYLLDAVIDVSQKPKAFLSAPILNDVKEKGVVKWLD